MSRIVYCPVCRRAVVWDASSPFRPFCSERCKWIDLGEWASEHRFIPGDDVVLDTEGCAFQEKFFNHSES